MKVKNHKSRLPVKNIIFGEGTNRGFQKHGELFPNNVRCICTGPSFSGKTLAVLSMLLNKNGLRFANIYLFSKTKFQPKYELLAKILDGLQEINFYSDYESVPDISQIKNNSVCIFDDILCEKQKPIQDLFSMGRHKSIDCIFIAQTYSKVCKQLIRDNANFLIIFQIDEKNLHHIYNDHVGGDMTFENFSSLCNECWKQKFGFLVICKESALNCGKYRAGFDKFIYISEKN